MTSFTFQGFKGQLISECLFGCHRFSDVCAFILWFDHFLDSGQKFVKNFVGFLENLKKSKRHSEINWPLVESWITYSDEEIDHEENIEN